MNKDKIKWLYQKTKNRYHQPWRYSFMSEERYQKELDEEIFHRFPCFRSKLGYRKLKRLYAKCQDFGVKMMDKKSIEAVNPWNEDCVSSWAERKSWKRNSKRKHQYKIHNV